MIDAETGWYAVPATVKAVVVSPERHVLLARNDRRPAVLAVPAGSRDVPVLARRLELGARAPARHDAVVPATASDER